MPFPWKRNLLLLLLIQSSLFLRIWGLKIILNNDDGFASAQIRELYRALNEAGHDAWIVAPAYDNSGTGGTLSYTTQANLSSAAGFDAVAKGKASFGQDPNDPKIWYYDGTPSVCTFFALDYVVPNYLNGSVPDLFVNGPNFGTNIGEFMYTFSGTLGATYSAIGRGIPAIAVSAGSYGPSRGFQSVNQSTASGFPDPATILANLTTQLVHQLAGGNSGGRLLPAGYGLNVNFPAITSLKDKSCLYPPFIRTRLSGDAASQKAVFDSKTGLFHGENVVSPDGINTCVNGNCTLPGESRIVNNYCQSSVSIFTINYDAPDNSATRNVDSTLLGLVTDEQTAKNYSSSTVGDAPRTQQQTPQKTVAANDGMKIGCYPLSATIMVLVLVSIF